MNLTTKFSIAANQIPDGRSRDFELADQFSQAMEGQQNEAAATLGFSLPRLNR